MDLTNLVLLSLNQSLFPMMSQKGQEVAKKAPGVGTVLARHFAGTLGPQGERKEMLRQQAVEFYRRKKETEKSQR